MASWVLVASWVLALSLTGFCSTLGLFLTRACLVSVLSLCLLGTFL